MATENKMFQAYHTFNDNDILYFRESFGWRFISASGDKLFFSRETTMPDYQPLKNLEHSFDREIALYVKYSMRLKVNKSALLVLAILTIVVGAILYVLSLFAINTYRKAKSKKHLKAYTTLLNEARSIRFSSHTSGLI